MGFQNNSLENTRPLLVFHLSKSSVLADSRASVLTIGQVAKQARVSLDTIRLYERYGLIEESHGMCGFMI